MTKRFLSFIGFLALLAGCGGGSGKSAAAGGSAADYFPMTLGATWTHDVHPAVGTGYSQTTVVTEASGTSCTEKRTMTNGDSYTLSYYELTASGALLVRSDQMTAEGALSSRTDNSPGLPIVPSDMTPGFTTTLGSRSVASTGTITTQTRAFTVNGVETVSVPAGTFPAMKYTILIDTPLESGTSAHTTMVRWHAVGVGLVKETSTDATAGTTTWTLTSYHIP